MHSGHAASLRPALDTSQEVQQGDLASPGGHHDTLPIYIGDGTRRDIASLGLGHFDRDHEFGVA